MQLFKYETHTHTSEVSMCADMTGVEVVQYYKDLGFRGVCITDHFLNGNTTVPHKLPWKERIDLFCEGYENAFEEGKRIGIDVFFGWEYSFRGTDFLTYGLDKEWLLRHPNLLEMSVNEYCDFVHEDGGFIVHAHPFREEGYIDMIRLLPRKVDAVEVFNACRVDVQNKYADEYADNYSLLKWAGSDYHGRQLKRLCGMQTSRQLESIGQLIREVNDNQANTFCMSIDS